MIILAAHKHYFLEVSPLEELMMFGFRVPIVIMRSSFMITTSDLIALIRNVALMIQIMKTRVGGIMLTRYVLSLRLK